MSVLANFIFYIITGNPDLSPRTIMDGLSWFWTMIGIGSMFLLFCIGIYILACINRKNKTTSTIVSNHIPKEYNTSDIPEQPLAF